MDANRISIVLEPRDSPVQLQCESNYLVPTWPQRVERQRSRLRSLNALDHNSGYCYKRTAQTSGLLHKENIRIANPTSDPTPHTSHLNTPRSTLQSLVCPIQSGSHAI